MMDGALPALPVDLDQLGERAADLARGARSPSTQRAYRSDWADFVSWARLARREALPASPATIGLYLTARAGERKVSTLTRRLAAISVAHRLMGHSLDLRHAAVREVLAGIRRVTD